MFIFGTFLLLHRPVKFLAKHIYLTTSVNFICVPGRLLITTFVLMYDFFSFLFSSFISLIADGPHHYHPACGHKGSSHLSPVHALQFFIAMQVQHSYNSSTNG